MRKILQLKWVICLLVVTIGGFQTTHAKETLSQDELYKKRMEYYERVEAVTQIPWYYLAAIDQYERTIRYARNDLPDPEGTIGIWIPEQNWVGWSNPDNADQDEERIQFFEGFGIDGDGDDLADRTNDIDVLTSFANYLLKYGTDHDNIKIALWNYYGRDKTVGLIMGKAKMYKTVGQLDLDLHAFPLPLQYNYSYKNTWGDSRGWGGRRIHEGTDIFADYGVPVLSTCYGVVEMKGWNQFGGWRVGIRDIHNNYHYYAHLSGFAQGLEIGQVVEPGTQIGGVGSSGYGPPGTSGKFPPHLHYGIYKDNGWTEWSFDPYPRLKLWERETRSRS
ncbi:M23 family metallopeptidase [Bacillus fonticola]|uniref:M23 family metallopeptidase n=1 Tax=Bacillus fonticola TaxID=2728853 RepID=UPI001473698F|nr:M23 family metallopeptidase [Bacillus fonticola]